MGKIVKVDQYTSVKIEDSGEYGWKLIEGWINREGEFRPNFCQREFKKGSGEKTVPVSIKLGQKDMAARVLKELMGEITGEPGQGFVPGIDNDDTEAPF